MLHRFPFATARGAARALRADLVLVAASIWAAASPFARSRGEWAAGLALGAACVLLNAALVAHQFGGAEGARAASLKTPADRSDVPRSLALAAQFVGTIGYIGARYGYARGLWRGGVACYLAAFATSAPVTAAHEREPLSAHVPWHRAGRNGFHEDFHALLFVADAIFTVMGVQFLLVQQPPDDGAS